MCVFVKVPEESDRAPGAKVEVVVSHPTWAPQTKLEIYEQQMPLAAEPSLQTNSLHLIWTSPSLYIFVLGPSFPVTRWPGSVY